MSSVPRHLILKYLRYGGSASGGDSDPRHQKECSIKIMKKPFISFTSDFGVQSQGVGVMEGVARSICPDAHIIHLMHGLPDFDIITGARTLETVNWLPIGYHVCVIDPGVGSKRRCLAIKTKRGDYLIGPDNGVLIPASRVLGGIVKVVEITNSQYMRELISPIFHGRDIFAPIAAWLAKGTAIEELGPEINLKELIPPPYDEAILSGKEITARVISINKFGSFHLNILSSLWDKLGMQLNEVVELALPNEKIRLMFVKTFSDVIVNDPLIMKDDYGRMEVAINQGHFISKHPLGVGDKIIVRKIEK